MGTYFLGVEPRPGGLGVGLGLLTTEISLLNFYQPYMVVGSSRSTSLALLPVWMDVVSLICSRQTSIQQF